MAIPVINVFELPCSLDFMKYRLFLAGRVSLEGQTLANSDWGTWVVKFCSKVGTGLVTMFYGTKTRNQHGMHPMKYFVCLEKTCF